MMHNLFAITINFHSDEDIKALKKSLESHISKFIVIDNSEINRGFAKAVNIGIKQALAENADHILLINPDIELSKSNLEKLCSTSFDIASPILEFSRTGTKVQDFGGKVNFMLGRPTHFENVRVFDIDFVSGACMLIKKEVFKKIGLFDERYFMYFEDVDFCLRAKAAGFEVGVAQNALATHHIHEHRLIKDSNKRTYILESNRLFINKWVPLIFKPLAHLYLFFLRLK